MLVAGAAMAFVLFGGQMLEEEFGQGTGRRTPEPASIDDPGARAELSASAVTTLADSSDPLSVAGSQTARRTIGSLPDMALAAGSAPTTALGGPAVGELPSSQTVALPAWRLRSPVSYANGAIKARPLPRSVTPIRRRAAVTATATKLAAQQFGGSLRPADVDTFFAEFDAPIGEWLGKLESVETEPRAAWFVVFTGMESSRATGIVTRRSDGAQPSTTVSLRVISDVVVVIDDDTGEVLVASEFLAEKNPSAC